MEQLKKCKHVGHLSNVKGSQVFMCTSPPFNLLYSAGYSSLHLAACWGHLETVRTLLELGADTKAKTFRGERPVDLARRYSKTDCADCLLLAGLMLYHYLWQL